MHKRFGYILLITSLILAFSAAYYSVFGLSRLFSSQFLAVSILAGTLEASKLITASYLHRAWSTISRFVKIYLTSAVLLLMVVTSLGIYGFLVSAYQDTAYKLSNLETVIKNFDTKKMRYQDQLNSLINEKKSSTKNIQQLTEALSNNRIQYTDRNGNQVIQTSSANRKAYESQLQYASTRLNEISKRENALSDSIMAIDSKIVDLKINSDVASEIGPLKYIATITGKSMDIVVNWLIIILIIVFDPLAIMLLISANKELNTKKLNTIVVESKPESQPAPEQETTKPQLLSYWNKLRNERSQKYKN